MPNSAESFSQISLCEFDFIGGFLFFLQKSFSKVGFARPWQIKLIFNHFDLEDNGSFLFGIERNQQVFRLHLADYLIQCYYSLLCCVFWREKWCFTNRFLVEIIFFWFITSFPIKIKKKRWYTKFYWKEYSKKSYRQINLMMNVIGKHPFAGPNTQQTALSKGFNLLLSFLSLFKKLFLLNSFEFTDTGQLHAVWLSAFNKFRKISN